MMRRELFAFLFLLPFCAVTPSVHAIVTHNCGEEGDDCSLDAGADNDPPPVVTTPGDDGGLEIQDMTVVAENDVTETEAPAYVIRPCERTNSCDDVKLAMGMEERLALEHSNQALPDEYSCDEAFSGMSGGVTRGVTDMGDSCACGDPGCDCPPSFGERMRAAVENTVDSARYQTNQYLLHETEDILNACGAAGAFRLPGLRDLPSMSDMFGRGLYMGLDGAGGLLNKFRLSRGVCRAFESMGIMGALKFGKALTDLATTGLPTPAALASQAETYALNRMGGEFMEFGNSITGGRGRHLVRGALTQRQGRNAQNEVVRWQAIDPSRMVPDVQCGQHEVICRMPPGPSGYARIGCCPQ